MQCWSYVGVVEMLKVNDIGFFSKRIFEMGWREKLWAYVYKGVEVKRLNGNANSFLCVRERKRLEAINQMNQIVISKH